MDPTFDQHRPPRAADVADCVHCGFCLPTCPTYQLWGEEMDSPRGRIHLIDQGLQGAPLSPAMIGHLDACLGCMACLPACPSGVRYDRLIGAARAQVERLHRRPRAERWFREAIFAVFPYPRRLRLLRGPLRLYQRSGLATLADRTVLRPGGVLRRRFPRMTALAQLAPPVSAPTRLPAVAPALGARRARVGLLTGCVQSQLFGPVNAATVRVLTAEGCEVVIPPGQGCCGALSEHAGRQEQARGFARALIDTFEAAGVEVVVVNSAGCGSAMKEYADLLEDDPGYAERAAGLAGRVRDVAQFLVELGPVAPRHPVPVTVAYHDACHLAHAQGVRSQPRELLRAIPGLELREVTEAAICCGSAGVYNLLHPDPAAELGDAKAANVLRTGAELLVTANPGCLLQIGAAIRRAGGRLDARHTIEVLDASINPAAGEGGPRPRPRPR